MASVKTSRILVIVLTIAAIAVAGVTFAAITINQNLSTAATITAGPNVGVYSNAACTTAVSTINWGSIEAGGTTTQTIYIEDTGGAAMTPSITLTNWSPAGITSYVTITWSTLPSSISPGVSNAAAVTFTVTVSSSIPTGDTSFSNSITISGTG